MINYCSKHHFLNLLLILLLISGCGLKDRRLKQDLNRILQSLEEPPHSILLSEFFEYGGGSDSRCDGYMLSRLYGTDEPIESIVEFIENEMLSLDMWSRDPRIPRDNSSINLISRDGYLLGMRSVELREDLWSSPFWRHKDVSLEQPYETIYQFNMVHIDPSYVTHCWGY